MDLNANVQGRQGHLPFGNDFAESGAQEKTHFTNYERDGETANDYAINRLYNKDIGRFSRVDPVASSGRIANPQSLHRFSYVNNDPLNITDPLGLDPFEVGCLWVWRCVGEHCFWDKAICPLSENERRRYQRRNPCADPGRQQALIDNLKALLDSVQRIADIVVNAFEGFITDSKTGMHEPTGGVLLRFLKDLIDSSVINPAPDNPSDRVIRGRFRGIGQDILNYLSDPFIITPKDDFERIMGSAATLGSSRFKSIDKNVNAIFKLSRSCPLNDAQRNQVEGLRDRLRTYSNSYQPLFGVLQNLPQNEYRTDE